MKRLFLILALLPLLGMGAGQSVITGHHRQVTAASPVLYGYTYCPNNGRPTVSTSTCSGGGSLTTAVGDVLIGICYIPSYAQGTHINLSDSNSNVYNQGGYISVFSYYPTASQTSWTVVTTPGATDFTCTGDNVYGNIGLIVLDYKNLVGTLNTPVVGVATGGGGSSTTSSTFTTTAKSLIVFCVASGTGGTWTAGNIGGSTAALVASYGNAACEARVATSSQSSITASISATGSGGDFAGEVLAFNY